MEKDGVGVLDAHSAASFLKLSWCAKCRFSVIMAKARACHRRLTKRHWERPTGEPNCAGSRLRGQVSLQSCWALASSPSQISRACARDCGFRRVRGFSRGTELAASRNLRIRSTISGVRKMACVEGSSAGGDNRGGLQRVRSEKLCSSSGARDGDR